MINWQNIANYLLQRKKLEETRRILLQNNSVYQEETNDPKNTKDPAKRRLRQQTEGPLLETSKLEVDEDSIKLTVVEDINVYLLHLELDQSRCVKILINVAKK